jgi:hypothetical protein
LLVWEERRRKKRPFIKRDGTLLHTPRQLFAILRPGEQTHHTHTRAHTHSIAHAQRHANAIHIMPTHTSNRTS